MIITDWTDDKAADFGTAALAFRHSLAERPMFCDERLIEVLDRYPRERLGVFTMGESLTDWTSWRRGHAGDLSGEQLFRRMLEGRLWFNLRDTDKHLPEYAELCAEIIADKEKAPGVRILRPDLGLLISSPKVEVLYHLDVPLSSLWQLRGRKQFRLYPRQPPFIGEEELESFVLRQREGQLAFEPDWDASSTVFDMKPGDMVTWPQNAPHRVSNGPMVNVSLSMEYMTPPALLRANVIYANGLLRRNFGMKPKVQERLGPAAIAKLAFARVMKSRPRPHKKAYTPILRPSFDLTQGA